MTLQQHLYEHIAAAFTGLWVQSHEHEDALAEIARLCNEHEWPLAVWDIDRGLQINGLAAAAATDPVAAVKSVNALALDDGQGSALLVLPNFHKFMSSAEIIQALAHQIHDGKQNRTFVVVLSPVVQIPVELEKQFVVIEHELPGRDQLEEIARGVATEKGELPEGESLTTVLDAAAGLTWMEAEGAFSLSLVRNGVLKPCDIWELKAGMLKKSGLLELHRGGETFDDLGGQDAIKAFCGQALATRPADALDRLCRYDWPGNVRELINVIERAMLLCESDEITLADLPAKIAYPEQASISALARMEELPAQWRGKTLHEVRDGIVENVERGYLRMILTETGGQVGLAAQRAGIHPRGLYDKMRKYGLRKEEFRRGGGSKD